MAGSLPCGEMLVRHGPQLVMGATLFTTPGLKHATTGVSSLIIALVIPFVAAVPLLIFRNRPRRDPDDPNPGDGWGKAPRGPKKPPPDKPRGGIPLDDAQPARMRLRGKGRLSDLRPRRPRRPAREPDRRPVRETTPS
jgi:hypothetical protein